MDGLLMVVAFRFSSSGHCAWGQYSGIQSQGRGLYIGKKGGVDRNRILYR